MTRRPARPLTRRESALALMAGAPPDWKAPEWCEKALNRKQSAKRKKPEEALQFQVCQYLATQSHLLWWHVPNSTYAGGNSDYGKRMGYLAKMKRLGVKRGVSDLIVIGPGPGVLMIELKSEDGRVSEEQEAFMSVARRLGCEACVCRSLEEVVEVVKLLNK